MVNHINLDQANHLLRQHRSLQCDYEICMGNSACLQIQGFQLCVCEDLKYGRFCEYDQSMETSTGSFLDSDYFIRFVLWVMPIIMIIFSILIAYIVRQKTIASMDKKIPYYRSNQTTPDRGQRIQSIVSIRSTLEKQISNIKLPESPC